MERALTKEEMAAIEPLVEQVRAISQEVIDEPMEEDSSAQVPSETAPPDELHKDAA